MKFAGVPEEINPGTGIRCFIALTSKLTGGYEAQRNSRPVERMLGALQKISEVLIEQSEHIVYG